MIRRLTTDNRGATAIEYGLIISMVVLAMLAALTAFAGKSVAMWNSVASRVQNADAGQ